MNLKMSDSESFDDVHHMFEVENSKESASADVHSIPDFENNKLTPAHNGFNDGKRSDQVKYSELCVQDDLDSNVPCEDESRNGVSKEEHLIALKNIEEYLGTIEKLEQQCQALEQNKEELQLKLEMVC